MPALVVHGGQTLGGVQRLRFLLCPDVEDDALVQRVAHDRLVVRLKEEIEHCDRLLRLIMLASVLDERQARVFIARLQAALHPVDCLSIVSGLQCGEC